MGRFVRPGRFVPAERLSEALSWRVPAAPGNVGSAAEAQAAPARSGRGGDAVAAFLAGAAKLARIDARAQEDVITLALEVARTVLALEIQTRPEQLDAAFDAAIGRLALAREIVLHVNPEDLPAAARRRDALATRLGDAALLGVVADESVARGGCVVESDIGRVDARLETQLAAIERALRADDG